METFAYLHTACAYEDPEAALSLVDCLHLKQLSSQAGLATLHLLVPVAILVAAGHASALQIGDRGPTVVTLQNQLRSAGYFNARSTGRYLSITADSVKRFQADNGLRVDGIAGPATMRALRGQASSGGGTVQPISYGGLRLGSRGSDVSTIQQQLRNLGYGISVDGVFGSATDRAVRQFQASNRLVADGIVGSATRNALYNGVNVGYNPNYPDSFAPANGGSYNNYVPPTYIPPATPIGGSAASIGKRYIVAIPTSNSNVAAQVNRYVPAFLNRSNLGTYVQAGSYEDRGEADARATYLRAKGFDAQVRYF